MWLLSPPLSILYFSILPFPPFHICSITMFFLSSLTYNAKFLFLTEAFFIHISPSFHFLFVVPSFLEKKTQMIISLMIFRVYHRPSWLQFFLPSFQFFIFSTCCSKSQVEWSHSRVEQVKWYQVSWGIHQNKCYFNCNISGFFYESNWW